ncbi:MAG: flavin reductase family protein [Candidatus Eisenbacteria bacterium]|nr:flavin reductase family protein [Candidatus Eisenbacteria bacterium]
MTGCIVPRPIGFLSTVDAGGARNLAPFSFFSGVSATPPTVAVSIASRPGGPKDTLRNIEETGAFVVNTVDEAIAEAMNLASGDFPPEVDEFEAAGLTPVPSERVQPPGVAEAPIRMECRLDRVIRAGDPRIPVGIVLGVILLFHVRDDLWRRGAVDQERLRAIGRMGGAGYCRTRDLFFMDRPDAG